MSKSKKPDINKILLKGYRRGVKRAIETAIRTNTSLIVEKNDKIIAIKPKYKYVRVPIKTSKKKSSITSRRKIKLRK